MIGLLKRADEASPIRRHSNWVVLFCPTKIQRQAPINTRFPARASAETVPKPFEVPPRNSQDIHRPHTLFILELHL